MNSAELSLRSLNDATVQPRSLRVTYDGREVGLLAMTPDGLCAFEYSAGWLEDGFSISPLSLPLENRLFMPHYLPFDGLWGVFNDSLPDGWGRLLVDRLLRRHGIDPAMVTPLTRLAIVGSTGMGALSYVPEVGMPAVQPKLDLDSLAAESLKMLEADNTDDLDALFTLGGSSGGARPKILTQINGEEWIIKFPAHIDPPNSGQQEYRYALAARDCGINMPEVQLFPSKNCSGYFGVKRFDRCTGSAGTTTRLHVVSASALLETSHRIPSLDYELLMRLCLRLTDSYEQLEQLYRLMCFNVLAHNRDDHSKNFSFIYEPTKATWLLSPAYDLTYNDGFNGEHATTVAGKGRDITVEDMVTSGSKMGLSKTGCASIASDIQCITHKLLLTAAPEHPGKPDNP